MFPNLAIYSEPLCETYASFGGEGSHMVNMVTTLENVWFW